MGDHTRNSGAAIFFFSDPHTSIHFWNPRNVLITMVHVPRAGDARFRRYRPKCHRTRQLPTVSPQPAGFAGNHCCHSVLGPGLPRLHTFRRVLPQFVTPNCVFRILPAPFPPLFPPALKFFSRCLFPRRLGFFLLFFFFRRRRDFRQQALCCVGKKNIYKARVFPHFFPKFFPTPALFSRSLPFGIFGIALCYSVFCGYFVLPGGGFYYGLHVIVYVL